MRVGCLRKRRRAIRGVGLEIDVLAKEVFNLAHAIDLNWLDQKGSWGSLFA